MARRTTTTSACAASSPTTTCRAASGCASRRCADRTAAFGSAGPTVPARELEHAGCILVIGSNTVESHPVLSFWVKRAARHGGKIILVDPRETDIARLSYLHLRPRPGTD